MRILNSIGDGEFPTFRSVTKRERRSLMRYLMGWVIGLSLGGETVEVPVGGARLREEG